MGFSLAVHIALVLVGIFLPLIIMIAEYLGIRYKDKYYLVLSRRLSTAFVIFFAVGTASGLLVAVNLLFLWPSFMALASQVAILPVFLEVFAFFMESIFLAIYIFSYKTIGNTYKHVAIIGIVVLGAALSAIFITMLNSWMNTPVGFNIAAYLQTGNVIVTNPLAVFTSPSGSIEIPHVLATTYFAGSTLFLAYFAYMFQRSKSKDEKQYYKRGMKISFAIALIGVFFSIVTGILSIQSLYYLQPEKYAAIELNLVSQPDAPELIGGIYSNVTNSISDDISIPGLQSVLATGSVNGTVPGLNQYPTWTWPPLIVHDMFDLMVILGFLIGIVMFVALARQLLRKDMFEMPIFSKLFMLCGAGAIILIENGWMVDEFGRQPWIIYNVMTVASAANQSQTIIPLAILIVIVYALIIPVLFFVLKGVFSKRPLLDELR